ncbi:MAG: polysaccharide deacetylase family protein [Bacteroidia bacterium]|nr:polysaccharide deacetylase family protein [Bacteroidia bacterium]
MYLIKIPKLVRNYYSEYIWRIPTDRKTVYLTFDDGPTPEVTDWVLEQLKAYKAKASFFLIGKNVRQHPDIVHRIIDAGHSIGNHTYNHVNGWKVSAKTYIKDFLLAQQTIAEFTGYQTLFFRPPYGKITTGQARQILKENEIVMMDVISADFDPSLSGEDCYHNVVRNSRKGSIVLLHDSVKGFGRLEYALPELLKYFSEKGYSFSSIPNSTMSSRGKKK